MTEAFSESESCWSRIGVWGDMACPELETAVHCRNCSVYEAAGRNLLERAGPEGYLEEWTAVLAKEEVARAVGEESVVLFRLGREWLGLSTQVFSEVIEDRVVHRLPHRSDEVFRGLVNVRGEIRLCINLAALLGLAAEDGQDQQVSHIAYGRMIVAEYAGQSWVFAVDEVHGIHRYHADELGELPVTIAGATATYARGLCEWQGRNVGCLDDDLLFGALQRRAL